MNGDGYGDVIVGAYYDNSQRGKAYVFHGSASGIPAVDDAGDADWSKAGGGSYYDFGRCVASAGDLNRDGYANIIELAPG